MLLEISSSCLSKMSKFSLSVKKGNVLSDTRDVDLHGAVTGGSGANGLKDSAIIKRVSAVMLVAL